SDLCIKCVYRNLDKLDFRCNINALDSKSNYRSLLCHLKLVLLAEIFYNKSKSLTGLKYEISRKLVLDFRIFAKNNKHVYNKTFDCAFCSGGGFCKTL